jgi:hypothetical protein
VQALVDWAGQKEDAIRAAGVRDRQLTNFDLPRAIDPTMYVGLSFFDRQLKPQWLFSIHAASGALDVSFQYMGHPPFDTEAGREPLRALLNEITGVDIPTARLRGIAVDPDDARRRGVARALSSSGHGTGHAGSSAAGLRATSGTGDAAALATPDCLRCCDDRWNSRYFHVAIDILLALLKAPK